MKIRIHVLLLAGLFFGTLQSQTLTTAETQLIKKLGFDAELMSVIKKETGHELRQLPAIDAETGDLGDGVSNGIHSNYEKDENYAVILKLKAHFSAKGYLVFIFNDDAEGYSIAAIKGKDETDIARFRQTSGPNHNVTNNDIVAKLKQWKAKSDFEILGCASDWIDVSFKSLPKNLDAFAKDVYAFCPDTVDQGAGDLDSLEHAIKTFKRLTLWWD